MCLLRVCGFGLASLLTLWDPLWSQTATLLERETLAKAAPPAYAAKALIRLASQSTEKERVRLAAEAHQLAALLPPSAPRLSTISGDSVEGTEANASLLGLDRLSLEVAAVELLVPNDPGEAARQLTQISLPLEVSTCTDASHVDLAKYYSLAAKIANGAFSVKERRRDDDIVFAMQLVSSATTAAQLDGAVRFVAALRPESFGTTKDGDSRLLSVIERLGVALGSAVAPDASAEVRLVPMGDAVRRLVRQHIKSRGALLNGYSEFARRQLTARCGFSDAATRSLIARTNSVLCEGQSSCSSRIAEDELPIRSTPKTPKHIAWFWRDPVSAALLQSLRELQSGSTRVIPEAMQGDSVGAQLLDAIGRWQGSKDQALLVSEQKLMLLERAIEYLDPSLRSRAVGMYFDTLGALDPSGARPPIWYWFANRTPKLVGKLKSEEQAQFTKVIEADPVLRIFATRQERSRVW